MDVIDNGWASAGFKTGNVIDLDESAPSSLSARFFSRHVAQGQAALNAAAVHLVDRPSVHLITMAESPSRAIDSG